MANEGSSVRIECRFAVRRLDKIQYHNDTTSLCPRRFDSFYPIWPNAVSSIVEEKEVTEILCIQRESGLLYQAIPAMMQKCIRFGQWERQSKGQEVKKKSDRYLKVVEWSEEDQCYIGSCPGLMFGGVHGQSEKAVYDELCQVLEEWVEQVEEDGVTLPEPTSNRKYSGRFVLRVSKDTHKALWIRAAQRGESLNSYCKRVLEKDAV